MFHLELRQFPHNACRFNLTDAEMWAVVEPWSRDEWIEEGERKWSPHQARLTVLEGPHMEVEDLAMGRGWRNAQHKSTDVTERVIAEALASGAAVSPTAQGTPAPMAKGAQNSSGANTVPGVGPASASSEGELRLLLGLRSDGAPAGMATCRRASSRAHAQRIAGSGRTDAARAGRTPS